MNKVVSLTRSLLILAAMLLAAPAARALDSGDIFVVSAQGEVRVTMGGAARAVRASSVLELPASVRTGHDGSIELRQGATTVSVGPDTVLEFPALERRGGPIDRIQQPRGNAFYNIGKRDGRKLRVETPYLVGVVKGTQFNVAAQEDATTISLFEGSLEIRAPDENSVVDLAAGEIAARRRGDKSISVIPMNSHGLLPATPPRVQGDADAEASQGSPRGDGLAGMSMGRNGDDVATLVAADVSSQSGAVAVEVGVSTGIADVGAASAVVAGPVEVDAGVATSVDVGADNASVDVSTNTSVDTGPITAGIDTSVAVDVGTGGIGADVTAGTSIDAGAITAGVDTGAAVDVGTGSIGADVTAGTSIDAGAITAGVDTGAAVDVGTGGIAADVTTDTTVDAGPITADVDTGAAVDVAAGGVGADITAGTAIDAGPVTTDLGTSTAVDVGTGGTVTVDTSADLGVVTDTPVDVSVGVSAGVDASQGTVDVGVAVGDVDLGLGADLGLGGSEPATDTGSSTTPATDTGDTGTTDLGGLLDGLLRRPGRK